MGAHRPPYRTPSPSTPRLGSPPSGPTRSSPLHHPAARRRPDTASWTPCPPPHPHLSPRYLPFSRCTAQKRAARTHSSRGHQALRQPRPPARADEPWPGARPGRGGGSSRGSGPPRAAAPGHVGGGRGRRSPGDRGTGPGLYSPGSSSLSARRASRGSLRSRCSSSSWIRRAPLASSLRQGALVPPVTPPKCPRRSPPVPRLTGARTLPPSHPRAVAQTAAPASPGTGGPPRSPPDTERQRSARPPLATPARSPFSDLRAEPGKAAAAGSAREAGRGGGEPP